MTRVKFEAKRFGEAARLAMGNQGVRYTDLQKAIQISPATISRVLHGGCRHIEAIYSVAAMLHLDVSEYLTCSKE